MELMHQKQSPVSQRIRSFLEKVPDPYHREISGLQVELRYKKNAPTLQEKIIALCQDDRQICS